MRTDTDQKPGLDAGALAWVIFAGVIAFILFIMIFAERADAQTPPEGVCPAWDGDGPWVGHFPGDGTAEITVTAPDGWEITDVCVKAGSVNQGDGPEFIHYDPAQTTVTFSHSSGKAVSHYALIKRLVTTTTTTSTTVPETTTTTVPEETTTTTVPEETTTTTRPGPDPCDRELCETTTTVPGDPTTTTTPDPNRQCVDYDLTTPECDTPRTGNDDFNWLALVGTGLLAGGTWVILVARRRRKAALDGA